MKKVLKLLFLKHQIHYGIIIFLILSYQGRIIERFTRYSDQQIYYEFEVSDPVFYSESWGGEISFNATDTKLYEYACHEGNYGLQGILGGYRRQEMDAQQASED